MFVHLCVVACGMPLIHRCNACGISHVLRVLLSETMRSNRVIYLCAKLEIMLLAGGR